MNDEQLLQSFAEHGSEAAFRTLVERHLPLVLGTARRITGESGLAEEVAQTVFILLARKARNLRPGTILSAWLYRATRFVAARALLAEQRRQRREQEAVTMQLNTDSDPAWQPIAPRLDDALGRLGQPDRNALLLRFFEQRPMRDLGASLGLSEEAARKRVARALKKLRRILSRRGTEVSTGALIAGLTHEGSTAAAEIGLATKIAAVALADLAAGAGVAAVGSALLADALAAWRWAQIKTVLGVGSGLVAVALLVPPVLRSVRNEAGRTTPALANETSGPSKVSEPTASNSLASREPDTIEIAGQTIPLRSLRVTVLDAQSDGPIPGAEGTHTLMGFSGEDAALAPLRADSNGIVALRIPERVPGGERMDYFEVSARAEGYAPRTIHWLSTTGNVLGVISTQYTVRLEPGITLSGTVG